MLGNRCMGRAVDPHYNGLHQRHMGLYLNSLTLFLPSTQERSKAPEHLLVVPDVSKFPPRKIPSTHERGIKKKKSHPHYQHPRLAPPPDDPDPSKCSSSCQHQPMLPMTCHSLFPHILCFPIKTSQWEVGNLPRTRNGEAHLYNPSVPEVEAGGCQI